MIKVVTIEVSELEGMLRNIISERQVETVSEVMTLKETAAHFKVSTQSILNWTNLAENPCPVHYFGDTPRFFLSELKQWSSENAQRKLAK